MHIRILLAATFLAVTSSSALLAAATHTVSKDGNGQYTTIQAAVNAAQPGDEIIIIDVAEYEEQVTIDSTKNGLYLHSADPKAAMKPMVRFTDTKNVGPRNVQESKIDTMINFDRNGALRLIDAYNVVIEGVAVDGGKVMAFGYQNVWEGSGQDWPNQFGNGGIVIFRSGNCIIRHCDVSNAFYGFNVKDRNDGGIFSIYNPSDIDSGQIMPFAHVGKTGNHVIEHNRIHHNSFGLYFESVWDMGSTIRHNLIYENHHPTTAFADKVNDLTTEGPNLPGGAILTKDHLVSPLAIYNNTFWHNHIIFVGTWKAGGQHLVFNNVFSTPEVYNTDASHLDMFKSLANRLYSNVFAAQGKKPATEPPVQITYEMLVAKAGDEITKIGQVTLDTNANNYYFEIKFMSTDPADEKFLVPDWNDSLVKALLLDKGWVTAGMKDPDGSAADIGALPQGGGYAATLATIRPVAPVEVAGTSATLAFSLDERRGVLSNASITMIRAIGKLDTSDVFGNSYKPVPLANIVPATPPASVVVGSNKYNVVAAGTMGAYGFYEVIMNANGSDGKPVTAVGFLPYCKMDYYLKVAIVDKGSGDKLDVVRSGEPLTLTVTAYTNSDIFTKKVYSTSVYTFTGATLHSEGGVPLKSIPGDIDSGAAAVTVVFPVVSKNSSEVIYVCGKANGIPFFGVSAPVMVLPPTSLVPRQVGSVVPVVNRSHFEIVDLRGRIVMKLTGEHVSGATIMQESIRSKCGKGVYVVREIDRVPGRVKKQHVISIAR